MPFCKQHQIDYPEGSSCYGRSVPNGHNRDKCCGDPVAEEKPGLPSAADLDAVAAEKKLALGFYESR
jgi:hypothetical protein